MLEKIAFMGLTALLVIAVAVVSGLLFDKFGAWFVAAIILAPVIFGFVVSRKK